MRSLGAVVFTFVLAVSAMPALFAQTDQWIPTAGPGGSIIKCLTSTGAGYVFAGTYGNGLFCSTDDGLSWKSANGGFNPLLGAEADIPLKTITALATSWCDNIFAGNPRGVYRSTDNGLSWVLVAPKNGLFNIEALAVDSSCNLVVAGFFDMNIGSGSILISTNGGATWSTRGIPNSSNAVDAISITKDSRVYAAIKGFGVSVSDNGGFGNWTRKNTGLNDSSSVASLIVHPSGTLYAGTGGGVYLTKDRGETWSRTTLNKPTQVLYIRRDGTICAGTLYDGTYFSSDSGATWSSLGSEGRTSVASLTESPIRTLFAGSVSLIRLPADSSRWQSACVGMFGANVRSLVTGTNGEIYAGADGSGLMKSTNRGLSWNTVAFRLALSVNPVVVTKAGTIFADVTVDEADLAPPGDGLFRSTDEGRTWSRAYAHSILRVVTGMTTNTLGHIFITLSGVYSPGQGGVLRSTDNGDTWSYVVQPSVADFTCIGVSPSGVLFAGDGSGRIHSSTDGGSTWIRSDSLGTANVRAFAFDRSGNAIAGRYGGHLLKSTNGGKNWFALDTPTLDSLVSHLASDSLGNLFAAADGWAGGWMGSVFLSRDNGNVWEKLDSLWPGLRPEAILATATGHLYAAPTEHGVYSYTVGSLSGVSESQLIPTRVSLLQNYPNPFNSSTTIQYDLPSLSHVTLTIFNTLGQNVRDLVNGEMEAGYHEVQFDAGNLASGVYLYRLQARLSPKDIGGQAGSFVQTRKLILLR